jgi:hypothetical protein
VVKKQAASEPRVVDEGQDEGELVDQAPVFWQGDVVRREWSRRLGGAAAVCKAAEVELAAEVAAARAAGLTWEQVALAVGVSRQAVSKRFGGGK